MARRQSERTTAQIDALDRERRRDPRRWLAHALDLLLASWLPDKRELLFGGVGAGLAAARGAIQALADHLVYTWQDELWAVWASWSSHHRDLDPEAIIPSENIPKSGHKHFHPGNQDHRLVET